MVIYRVRDGAGRIYSCQEELALEEPQAWLGSFKEGSLTGPPSWLLSQQRVAWGGNPPCPPPTYTLTGSKKDQALDVMTFFMSIM